MKASRKTSDFLPQTNVVRVAGQHDEEGWCKGGTEKMSLKSIFLFAKFSVERTIQL